MKRTLATLAFGAALGFAGCASQEEFKVKDDIRGHRIGSLTEDYAPYHSDAIIIAGKPHFVEYQTHQLQGELPFLLRSAKETKTVRDALNREISRESDSIYVAEPLFVPERNEAGEIIYSQSPRMPPVPVVRLAREVEFNTSGAYAVKAQLTPFIDTQLGVQRVTQDSAEFKLKAAEIDGKSYFFPIIVDEKSGRVTERLIVPAYGTQIITDGENGAITLRNPGNIYHFKEIPMREYLARPATVQAPKGEISTPSVRVR